MQALDLAGFASAPFVGAETESVNEAELRGHVATPPQAPPDAAFAGSVPSPTELRPSQTRHLRPRGPPPRSPAHARRSTPTRHLRARRSTPSNRTFASEGHPLIRSREPPAAFSTPTRHLRARRHPRTQPSPPKLPFPSLPTVPNPDASFTGAPHRLRSCRRRRRSSFAREGPRPRTDLNQRSRTPRSAFSNVDADAAPSCAKAPSNLRLRLRRSLTPTIPNADATFTTEAIRRPRNRPCTFARERPQPSKRRHRRSRAPSSFPSVDADAAHSRAKAPSIRTFASEGHSRPPSPMRTPLVVDAAPSLARSSALRRLARR